MELMEFTQAKRHKNINCSEIVRKIKLNKKIIGIGETGLDFITTL